MFCPVTLVPVLGVIVSCCLVAYFYSSSAVWSNCCCHSLLAQKKAKKKLCFACSHNEGVVTIPFAPVARQETVRMMISLAAHKKWSIHHMDVKSSFLNGYLEEEVFVEQPQGFEVQGKEHQVYKLKKALYGLKQAPRTWYARIDGYFQESGFNRSKSEPTLYYKQEGNDYCKNNHMVLR
jgi:hypothetical protein